MTKILKLNQQGKYNNQMRVKLEKDIFDVKKLKCQLLQWANQFEHVVWLDSNAYPFNKNRYEAILAVGAKHIFQSNSPQALNELKEYRQKHKEWLFGYLSFDLDKIYNENQNIDFLNFSKVYFFQPEKIFFISLNNVEVQYNSQKEHEIEEDWRKIESIDVQGTIQEDLNFEIKPRLSKKEYLRKVKEIQDYIQKGEIEEVNFCQEFYANGEIKSPLKVYQSLNSISETPFASYLRIGQKYALCASPERYLSGTNRYIKSQPIKGTAKRKQDPIEDKEILKALQSDKKEIIENTIIAEMVAEELRTIAENDEVTISELCKAYTFKQVHQLISTVVCKLKSGFNAVDVIKATYPMGSMTGIPKQNAMKLIHTLENFNRSLYSGSIGYFAPNDDFDFNVVIRSILYNAKNNYVSYAAGGAITALSNPESEYEECLVKAKAMGEVLGVVNVNKEEK